MQKVNLSLLRTVKRSRPGGQRCGRKPSKSKQSTKCAYCNVAYGAENDTRRSDDSLKCQACNSWLHKSCAEIVGVIDDKGLACKDLFLINTFAACLTIVTD